MRIIIESIVEEQNEKILIIGVTKIGRIKGSWKASLMPKIGERYNVELTLPALKDKEVLILKDNSLLAQTSIGSDNRVYFQGTCEFIDEDDIYVVRFAPDWIEMLDIDSKRIYINDVISFSIPNDQIEIYPYYI